MKLSATIISIYALLVLLGGFIGYLKAKSLPSFIVGGSFSFFLLCFGIAIFKKNVTGCFAALALASILALFFTYHFFLTYLRPHARGHHGIDEHSCNNARNPNKKV